MKYRIEVVHKEVVQFDAGDLPKGLVEELVRQLLEGFGKSLWSLGDVGDDEWTVVEHSVTEVK